MIKTIDAAKACTAILLAIALSACATKLGRNFDDVTPSRSNLGKQPRKRFAKSLGVQLY